MLQKVEHIGIIVSDLDRSIAFYTTVLGLPLRKRVRLNETTELAFLTVGDSEIELIHKNPPVDAPLDGVVNHVAFTVADVAGTLAHLRRHGVALLNEAPVELGPLGARAAFFRGPDGEKLELFTREA